MALEESIQALADYGYCVTLRTVPGDKASQWRPTWWGEVSREGRSERTKSYREVTLNAVAIRLGRILDDLKQQDAEEDARYECDEGDWWE